MSFNRLTARRALIEASPSSVRSQEEEHTTNVNVGNQQPGVENLAYENEPEHKDKPKIKKTGKAVLHFPHPPASSPTSRYAMIFVNILSVKSDKPFV